MAPPGESPKRTEDEISFLLRLPLAWTVSARKVPELEGTVLSAGAVSFSGSSSGFLTDWIFSAVARRARLRNSRVILDRRGYPWPIGLSMVLF